MSDAQQVLAEIHPHHSYAAVDFFMSLPLELVYAITSYLSLPSFLSCLVVCEAWNLKLSEMYFYWRDTGEELGLSRRRFEQLVARYSSAKNVVYRVLEHRHSIWSNKPTFSQYGNGFPYFMHYVCHQVKGEVIAGTVYKNFCPYRIMVERIVGERMQTIAAVQPKYPLYTEHRIIWAHIFRGSHLFCASASGLWSVYNFSTPNKKTLNASTVLQWKAEAMFEPDIRLDCCNKCAMMCTARLVLDHQRGPHWDLRVVEMSKETLGSAAIKTTPLPSVTRFQLKTNNKILTSNRNTYAKKKVLLLSTAETCQQGSCSSHCVLMQWAGRIESYDLLYQPGRSKALLVMPHGNTYDIHTNKEDANDAILRNRGLNTEFALTEDRTRLGFVFQSELVTWELGVASVSSRAALRLKSSSHEEIKLLALGHMYSLVGLEYSQALMVVATRTGENVLVCSDFAVRHCAMLAPYVVFCSSTGHGWLSDITQTCKSSVMYWNKTNRCMEAIHLGQGRSKDNTAEPLASRNTSRRKWLSTPKSI